MKDELKKTIVFWHATGHMIAAHYNHLYYGGLATEQILINQLGTWYYGEHIPHTPFSQDADQSFQQRAAAIAFYSYGSILQAIWQLAPLCEQFNSVKGSGRSDYLAIMDQMKTMGIAPAAQQSIFDQINTHIHQIRSDNLFHRLFDLPTLSLFRNEVEDFSLSVFKDEVEDYSIDVTRHAKNLVPFLQEHEGAYKSFVASLQLAMTRSLAIPPQQSLKKGIR